jgi:hypothetical protein
MFCEWRSNLFLDYTTGPELARKTTEWLRSLNWGKRLQDKNEAHREEEKLVGPGPDSPVSPPLPFLGLVREGGRRDGSSEGAVHLGDATKRVSRSSSIGVAHMRRPQKKNTPHRSGRETMRDSFWRESVNGDSLVGTLAVPWEGDK